jgi:tetratricopeptide (TPR) repeat protein
MPTFDPERGCFDETDADRAAVERFDELLERRDGGELTETAYKSALADLIAEHPGFIDGHAHLGFALREEGKTKRALAACLAGMGVGEDALPAGYDGTLEWCWLENRPFLRAAHGVVLCRMALRQRSEATALMERMLRWNPGDNQGIRYLIGSEALRLGEIAKARRWLEAAASAYPPCRYDLALLQFRERDHAGAATTLRLGFLENLYVAEALLGMAEPMPLIIWHGSNFAEPEIAADYVRRHRDLWDRTPQAIAFLRWLFMHPQALRERAAMIEREQELHWETDTTKRRKLIDQQDAERVAIMTKSSTGLVGQRPARDGAMVMPWMGAAARRPGSQR